MPNRHLLLALAVVATVVVASLSPPIAHPPEYHLFVDQRPLLGVTNSLDVLSNIPFAIVGVLGLAVVAVRSRDRRVFADPWDRWPYAALFLGVALASAGSAYYHLAPDHARVVWDRLPMTVGFMALLTALLAERVSRRLARTVFVLLLVAGALSVVYWYWSELQQAGDLRPYLVVQFGSLAMVGLILALYRAPAPGTAYLVAGLAAYAAAKGLELADGPIFIASGQTVSGHTLKHLVAAAGVGCLVVMLRTRARSRV